MGMPENWAMFICNECGGYQVIEECDDPTRSGGGCHVCGSADWVIYPSDEYRQTEHWRFVCLARHILRRGSAAGVNEALAKFARKNGKALAEKVREFCRIEYKRNGGYITGTGSTQRRGGQ